MPNKPFRIAMIPSLNGGVNYYRLATWAFQMRKYKNVEAALFAFQYDMNEIHPWQKDFMLNANVRDNIDRLCEYADIVIWHPVHYDNTFDFYMEMRHKHDKPMLVEMDDNILDAPEWSEAFGAYSPNSQFRNVVVNHMRNSDGITVTTPHLQTLYNQFNDHVYVVPNSLDFKGDSKFVGWDTVSVRKHRDIRLGWIAGRAHFADLMMVAPAVRKVLEKHSEVKLCIVNSALKESCQILGKPYPFEGLTNVHYADRSVPINRYARFMSSFGFDVGMAPLVDCNFNRSKSNLRWLEYSALKIPTIATDISHFQQSIDPNNTGILIKDNNLDHWVEAMELLIEDQNVREMIGRAAYKKVKKDYNVKRNAAEYVRMLKTISNQSIPMDQEDYMPEFPVMVGASL